MDPERWAELGGDPAPGQPDALEDLAEAMARRASLAETLYGQIQELSLRLGDCGWDGPTAEAFWQRFGQLHPHLLAHGEAQSTVAARLRGWAERLREHQAAARTLLHRAEDGQQDRAVILRQADDLRDRVAGEAAAVAALVTELVSREPLHTDPLDDGMLRLLGAQGLLLRVAEGADQRDLTSLRDAVIQGPATERWAAQSLRIAEAIRAVTEPRAAEAVLSSTRVGEAGAVLRLTAGDLTVELSDGWVASPVGDRAARPDPAGGGLTLAVFHVPPPSASQQIPISALHAALARATDPASDLPRRGAVEVQGGGAGLRAELVGATTSAAVVAVVPFDGGAAVLAAHAVPPAVGVGPGGASSDALGELRLVVETAASTLSGPPRTDGVRQPRR